VRDGQARQQAIGVLRPQRQASASLIVFSQLLDPRLCAAPEWRLLQVLAANRPVQHVPEQLDRLLIDADVRHRSSGTLANDAWFAEISDEVLDVRGLDLRQRAAARVDVPARMAVPTSSRMACASAFVRDSPALAGSRECRESCPTRRARSGRASGLCTLWRSSVYKANSLNSRSHI
jgi:hypothetical protein